jgi:hypothetical protein
MQIDRAAEWQRLTPLYREMCDEELLGLAAAMSDLTEMAQQVLRDELRRRGISAKPEQPSAQSSKRDAFLPPSQWETAMNLPAAENSEEDADSATEYTWKTLLCECGSREEAWQIYEVLRRAGIDSWIQAPGSRAIDLTGPRVVVAADQLDQAREIAARPIPQDIVDASKETLPEFEPPKCPRCGAADPALESADPVNAWRCELCARRWTEGEAKPDAKSDLAPQRTLP